MNHQRFLIVLGITVGCSGLFLACTQFASDGLRPASLQGEFLAGPLTPKEKSMTFLQQGVQEASQGDYPAAIAAYTQALNTDPANADAYYNRGVAHYYLGKPQLALEDFTQAIQLDPRYPEAYGNRGELRLQAGDWQGAHQDFRQAATLFAQQGDSASAQQMYNLIQKR